MSEPEYVKSVSVCARKAGIETLDTWLPLVEMRRNDFDAYRRLYVMHNEGRDYGHMSSDGNAFIARLIAERLSARAP